MPRCQTEPDTFALSGHEPDMIYGLTVEEMELPECAPESDLAVAESLLAALLVRFWRDRQQNTSQSQRESGAENTTSYAAKS